MPAWSSASISDLRDMDQRSVLVLKSMILEWTSSHRYTKYEVSEHSQGFLSLVTLLHDDNPHEQATVWHESLRETVRMRGFNCLILYMVRIYHVVSAHKAGDG